jgi:hypothetical protein
MTRDPRSESEKALADLKRNDELGMAVPESPAESRPSVTPATFGERTEPGYERRPVDREERDDPLPEAP